MCQKTATGFKNCPKIHKKCLQLCKKLPKKLLRYAPTKGEERETEEKEEREEREEGEEQIISVW